MDTLFIILRRLKELNKKQIDLTNYLDLKKNAFSDWKSGRSNSYLKYISQIAEFLEVSTDYLLNNEIKKAPSAEVDKATELYEKFKALPQEQQKAIEILINQKLK